MSLRAFVLSMCCGILCSLLLDFITPVNRSLYLFLCACNICINSAGFVFLCCFYIRSSWIQFWASNRSPGGGGWCGNHPPDGLSKPWGGLLHLASPQADAGQRWSWAVWWLYKPGPSWAEPASKHSALPFRVWIKHSRLASMGPCQMWFSLQL